MFFVLFLGVGYSPEGPAAKMEPSFKGLGKLIEGLEGFMVFAGRSAQWLGPSKDLKSPLKDLFLRIRNHSQTAPNLAKMQSKCGILVCQEMRSVALQRVLVYRNLYFEGETSCLTEKIALG